MDIVKGPGSAVYGPQGEGAGGYVDFVMKEPYFNGFQGDIDGDLGRLDERPLLFQSRGHAWISAARSTTSWPTG